MYRLSVGKSHEDIHFLDLFIPLFICLIGALNLNDDKESIKSTSVKSGKKNGEDNLYCHPVVSYEHLSPPYVLDYNLEWVW